MAKKEEKDDSVVVDVDNDVTSVSSATIDAVAEAINEVPKSEIKRRKSKKVADLSLEVQLSDMEKALENAKNAIESAVADNERMADELDISVAENKSLRKELSKCKQDYKKVQADNRANSALVDTLDGELKRFKVQNKELIGTISRLQDKIKQYADELSTKDVEISALTFDRSQLENVLSGYKEMSLWMRIKYVFIKDKVFMKKK